MVWRYLKMRKNLTNTILSSALSLPLIFSNPVQSRAEESLLLDFNDSHSLRKLNDQLEARFKPKVYDNGAEERNFNFQITDVEGETYKYEISTWKANDRKDLSIQVYIKDQFPGHCHFSTPIDIFPKYSVTDNSTMDFQTCEIYAKRIWNLIWDRDKNILSNK